MKLPKPPYNLDIDSLAQFYGVHLETGLTSAQAAKRLRDVGPNVLKQKEKSSPWTLFFSQFNDFIIWVLIGAAVISGFLQEWIDASAIITIVILNAILGFVQEYRAEKSLEALKKLSVPKARVYRNGTLCQVASGEIVPGDVLALEAGDNIPADARVTLDYNFSTQESSLTGESTPVNKTTKTLEKEITLAERNNMVYHGTFVASGKGRGIVTATGMETELGKIATMLQAAQKEETPLQRRLEKLGKKLVYLCLAIVAVVFVTGTWEGGDLLEMFMTAVSLAVAAVPEGLPAVVTIALAFGVKKMVKRNALIRKLPSVETLGCTTVICSDKTGTLTQNEMTVRKLWVNGALIDVSGSGYEPKGKFEASGKELTVKLKTAVEHLLQACVLCNGAALTKEKDSWKIIGDPTEGSLLTAGMKAGLSKESLENQYKLVGEVPFESNRKMMSMIRQNNGTHIVFVKGAPDVILKHCSKIELDGKVVPLDAQTKENILKTNEDLAGEALRVLGIAQRPLDEKPNEFVASKIEKDLVFIGLAAMIDPPRPEVKVAVQKCRDAGIRSVMITGDHKNTAEAVAREIGMFDSGYEAVSGQELEEMDDTQLKERVDKIAIYARVTAEHKMRIIRAWQEKGEIVAMTGDGVNDAPAIKHADIGVGMGITGTDVTKEVSDMVITDDNFASIVNAVEEGRGIYDNIKKFVNYLLSCNLGEVLVIFTALLFDWRGPDGGLLLPLIAVQILWMNLVTDGLPAIALGLDPVDPHVMKRPPRSSKERILSLNMGLNILVISLLITAASLFAFKWGLHFGVDMGRTMAFTTLVFLEIARIQMIRSHYSISMFSNPFLIVAILISLGLQLMVVYTPLDAVFRTVPITWEGWGVIAGCVAVVFVLGQLCMKPIEILTKERD